jgi:energy-coupling factor transport system permease protein
MAWEYVKGDTAFHRLDPRVKFLFWVTILFLNVAFFDPIWLGCVLLIMLAICKWTGIPRRAITYVLKVSAWAWVGYGIFTAFSLYSTAVHGIEHYHVIWLVQLPWGWVFPLTWEGTLMGIRACMMVWGFLIALRTFTMLTPLRDVSVGFVKMKMPPEFAIAIPLAISYVPVLIDENDKIRQALQSRGWDFGGANLWKRAKALLSQMLIPAIMGSFRRARFLAVALESRGFSYNIAGRTYVRELKLKKNDYIAIGLLAAAWVFGLYFGQWYTNIANITFTIDLLKKVGII